MAQSGFVSLPVEVGPSLQLADQIADWVLVQLGEDQASSLRSQAIVRVRLNLQEATPQLAPNTITFSVDKRLATLADEAVNYVVQLKGYRSLGVDEIEIALSWMRAEVAELGLDVSEEQMRQAV